MGGPAALGHGVMEVQLEGAVEPVGCREGCPSWSYAGVTALPESTAILPAATGGVDRPVGSIGAVRTYWDED
jgi:hypothetical protein